MKMVGERSLNAVVDSLADVRKAKIKEAFEKATVKCKVGGAAPPTIKPAAPLAKKAPPKTAPPVKDELLIDDVEPPKKVAKPPARLMVSVLMFCMC